MDGMTAYDGTNPSDMATFSLAAKRGKEERKRADAGDEAQMDARRIGVHAQEGRI